MKNADENSGAASKPTWASKVEKIQVPEVPDDAVNINVEGQRIAGPVQGFGQLWQKTYQVPLTGVPVAAQRVVGTWKQDFAQFWPPGNRFYGPKEGIQPGSVAILNLAGPEKAPLIATGIVVVYVDEDSFSFMTPEGHMFAGIITFSAFEEGGTVVAQVQALVRASDPLYELGLRLGIGHRAEDIFWRTTLENLARYYAVTPQVTQHIERLDARVQWREAGNLWKNAAMRTMLYHLTAPVRWLLPKKKH